MPPAPATLVTALALLLGCHAGRPTPPPEPPSPTVAATLALPRILGSANSDAIVAWDGSGPHLCVLRVASRSAVCTVPAAVANDTAGDFTIVGVSPSLRYLALRLADELRIYETTALRVVASVPVGDRDIGPVDFDPDETRAVWMQAGAPQLLTLASGTVTTSPPLPGAGASTRIRWLSRVQRLAWGADHPPIVVHDDGAPEIVKLPSTSWAGSSVDIRGERIGFATNSGLVAVFTPQRGGAVQLLRAPGDAGFKLDVVQLDPTGRWLLTVRGDERSAEVGLFDTAGTTARLLSTPGGPMFAGFSGDGSEIAWANEDPFGINYGGALFPSFTTAVGPREDLAHVLGGTFLAWSGPRMLVHAGPTCLQLPHQSIFCRDQRWAPFPETHRAGEVLWVGGDHILRADPGERRVTELYVTGTVDRPVLQQIDHPLDPADPRTEDVVTKVNITTAAPTEHLQE